MSTILHRARATVSALGRSWRPGAAWLAAALLVACGGGVDSGGTGSPQQQKSSFASGPITGFGSVIVNGVRFDDATASVTDALGNPRSRDDLRLGMTAQVSGGPLRTDSAGNTTSTASRIVFASAIVGPLRTNDLAGRTLGVLALTVDVSADTVFDASLVGGQAALAIGDIVEVYAQVDVATGHYVATRIDRRPSATAFELRGIVASLDAAARRFSIGATRISYAGLSPAGVPAGLAEGRTVRAVLDARVGPGGVWTALALAAADTPVGDDEDARVRGRVSAFTSALSFSVDGTPVDARTARFPNGTALALGWQVEVRGATSAGVLVATEVRLIADGDGGGSGGGESLEITDAIASLDPVALTFVVRNTVVGYGGNVEFRNGTAADLAVGRRVEVRGALSADGTRLLATRIEFRR